MSLEARRGASVALRAPEPSELAALQAIWDASSREDDPAPWPGDDRGLALSSWPSETRAVLVDGQAVGVVAVRAEAAPDGGMPARVALAPEARQAANARALVDGVVEVVRAAGGSVARVFALGGSTWLVPVLRSAGFQHVRTIAHMLLAADAPTPDVRPSEDWRLRAMSPGEDAEVLAALNRNWAGTWNFVEITPEMLQADLDGQREGMLLGVTDEDRIIATCHAMFDERTHNPDGAPHAWISNVTTDPAFRGRGIARAMLAAGIRHLRARGATSVTLGVDADDPAPFRLYQSVGFQIASRLEAWDAPVSPTGRPR